MRTSTQRSLSRAASSKLAGLKRWWWLTTLAWLVLASTTADSRAPSRADLDGSSRGSLVATARGRPPTQISRRVKDVQPPVATKQSAWPAPSAVEIRRTVVQLASAAPQPNFPHESVHRSASPESGMGSASSQQQDPAGLPVDPWVDQVVQAGSRRQSRQLHSTPKADTSGPSSELLVPPVTRTASTSSSTTNGTATSAASSEANPLLIVVGLAAAVLLLPVALFLHCGRRNSHAASEDVTASQPSCQTAASTGNSTPARTAAATPATPQTPETPETPATPASVLSRDGPREVQSPVTGTPTKNSGTIELNPHFSPPNVDAVVSYASIRRALSETMTTSTEPPVPAPRSLGGGGGRQTPSIFKIFRSSSSGTSSRTGSFRKPQSAIVPTAIDVRHVTKSLPELQDALSIMYSRGELFLGKYAVWDRSMRRSGGQSVVQFMQKDNAPPGVGVAVKFFIRMDAYEQEVTLAKMSVLQGVIPQVIEAYSNSDGRWHSEDGFVFPAFMVMQRGTTLTDWVRARKGVTWSQCICALAGIAERVAVLHAHGWLHRDLKPSNIMQLQTEDSWRLLDLGCAAPAGKTVSLAYTLSYACPEVILAAEQKEPKVKATLSMDVWSLGVIAFELLTRTRCLPRQLSPDECKARIVGRAPLPWETSEQATLMERLGNHQESVMRCLDRDPSRRPSARELAEEWGRLCLPIRVCTTRSA